LDRGNVFTAPGFWLAVLSGRYDPAARNIQLIWRAICAGDKLKQLMEMDDCETTPRMFDWEIGLIDDLPSQIGEMMPNRITEWPERWKGHKQIRRMREPYHSIYLMWLARASLSEMVFSDGLVVDRQSGLTIESD